MDVAPLLLRSVCVVDTMGEVGLVEKDGDEMNSLCKRGSFLANLDKIMSANNKHVLKYKL